eukprot:6490868-Amphidinium_carterae.1
MTNNFQGWQSHDSVRLVSFFIDSNNRFKFNSKFSELNACIFNDTVAMYSPMIAVPYIDKEMTKPLNKCCLLLELIYFLESLEQPIRKSDLQERGASRMRNTGQYPGPDSAARDHSSRSYCDRAAREVIIARTIAKTFNRT